MNSERIAVLTAQRNQLVQSLKAINDELEQIDGQPKLVNLPLPKRLDEQPVNWEAVEKLLALRLITDVASTAEAKVLQRAHEFCQAIRDMRLSDLDTLSFYWKFEVVTNLKEILEAEMNVRKGSDKAVRDDSVGSQQGNLHSKGQTGSPDKRESDVGAENKGDKR